MFMILKKILNSIFEILILNYFIIKIYYSSKFLYKHISYYIILEYFIKKQKMVEL